MIEAPTPYRITPPIVFYGSSITQGGCASRPGTTYDSMVCRRLDADYVNLGFSGNARGEEAITSYIKNLPMSVFVYDYDHNAPTVEHLAATHEKMFRAIREANPELPILILQRPVYRQNEEEARRLAILTATYENARASGDKNVYLITGEELMALAEDDGTVDGCHPNDLGFASMAKAVGEILEKVLK
jgi:lysophospholipase L1-like esterase